MSTTSFLRAGRSDAIRFAIYAGQSMELRIQNMAAARCADDPAQRRRYVACARRHNHFVVGWLRDARRAEKRS